MHLTTIPLSEVKNALTTAKAQFNEQTRFNTHFHTQEELDDAIPGRTLHVSTASYKGSPWVPLKPWLPLIARSQGFLQENIHTILLPRNFCTVLLSAINEDDMEDMAALFPKETTTGRTVSSLFSKGEQYFLRLDDNSVKDAKNVGGSGALKELPQIWKRLAASERGKEGIRHRMLRGESVEVFLLPWRDDFDISREYRVFCPPCLEEMEGIKISAICQYRWYEACGFDFTEDTAMAVLEGARRICSEIVPLVEEGDDLLRCGFVFDIFHTVEGEVQLIELNPFGAMSGCGSCLFSWARDTKVLYGLEEEIEFRICH